MPWLLSYSVVSPTPPYVLALIMVVTSTSARGDAAKEPLRTKEGASRALALGRDMLLNVGIALTRMKSSLPSGMLPSWPRIGFSAMVLAGMTRVWRSEPGPHPMSMTERTPSLRSTSSAQCLRCIHSLCG